MGINKKGSRKIEVEGHSFRWRASGNNKRITVIVWPDGNDNSRVVGTIEYHHDLLKVAEGHRRSKGQIIVTNRVIRELILHVGVEKLLENHGQIHIGKIENFYDISKALRSDDE